MKIAVIDYGTGNIHSVLKSLEFANQQINSPAEIILTSSNKEIKNADKIVFPGQGAMPYCMHSLHNSELGESLLYSFKNKPFFGICVGAQLLFEHSEEGNTKGLGWFEGQVKKFIPKQTIQDKKKNKFKIPHMGWNQVFQEKKHPIFNGIEQDAWFYFVHSYYFEPKNAKITLAVTHYHHYFSCIVGKDNVFATQFHVEKSHHAGLKMLQNFILWDGQS